MSNAALDNSSSKIVRVFFLLVTTAIVFFSVATTLRVSSLPLGISELLAVGCLIFFASRSGVLFFTLNPVVIFWLGFLSLIFISMAANLPQPPDLHNLISYIYDFGIVLLFSYILKNIRPDLLKKNLLKALVIAFVLLSFGFLIFLSRNEELLLGFRVNAYGPRYAGWSINPNQLALLVLPVPFLCIGLFSQFRSYGSYVAFLLLTCTIGIFVRSDALVYSWSLTLIAFPIVGYVFRMKYNKKAYYTCLGVFVLLMGLFQIFLNGTGNEMLNEIFPAPSKQYQYQFSKATSPLGVGLDENKVGVRRILWTHAFESWREAPVIGKGPGSFSYVKNPEEKIEAHNTFLDIATQTGIIGFLLFVGFVSYLAFHAIRNKDLVSLFILTTVVMFSGAHFTLRQPVFSIFILLSYYCASNKVWNET